MALLGYGQVLNVIEWRDETRFVRREHLLHEGQQRRQNVVRFEAAFCLTGFEEFQERGFDRLTHRWPPLWPAFLPPVP